jgi:hypothetical protein
MCKLATMIFQVITVITLQGLFILQDMTSELLGYGSG